MTLLCSNVISAGADDTANRQDKTQYIWRLAGRGSLIGNQAEGNGPNLRADGERPDSNCTDAGSTACLDFSISPGRVIRSASAWGDAAASGEAS